MDARSGRDALEGRLRDERESPLLGQPLPYRIRLGPITVGGYLAARGGPLPYMRRLRSIELEETAQLEALARAQRELAEACAGDERAFERRWRALAARWDFGEIDDLIERHNRCYPAESRLPMDPRTGDFVLVSGRSYVRRPLDAGWVLARFPC